MHNNLKSILKPVFALTCFCLGFACATVGQSYRDELRSKSERYIKCATAEQLADSVFSAIKTRIFDSLETYTPSYFTIKEAYDTLELNQNDQFVLIKQQYLVHNLYKDFKKLQVYARKNKLNLKFIELDRKELQFGKHRDGYPFAQVKLHVSRNNKKSIISFIAIQVLDNWYIGDELKMMPEPKEMPYIPFSLPKPVEKK